MPVALLARTLCRAGIHCRVRVSGNYTYPDTTHCAWCDDVLTIGSRNLPEGERPKASVLFAKWSDEEEDGFWQDVWRDHERGHMFESDRDDCVFCTGKMRPPNEDDWDELLLTRTHWNDEAAPTTGAEASDLTPSRLPEQ